MASSCNRLLLVAVSCSVLALSARRGIHVASLPDNLLNRLILVLVARPSCPCY
jgi:hypothetical protein